MVSLDMEVYPMPIKWNLRMVMAKKGIWSGAELGRLLKERTGLVISPAGLSRLMNEEQTEMKLRVLDALCTVLECEIDELIYKETSVTSFKNEKNSAM